LGEADITLKAELQHLLEELDRGLAETKNTSTKKELINMWLSDARNYFYKKYINPSYRFIVICFSPKQDRILALVLHKERPDDGVEPKIAAEQRKYNEIEIMRPESEVEKILGFLKSLPFDPSMDKVSEDLRSLSEKTKNDDYDRDILGRQLEFLQNYSISE